MPNGVDDDPLDNPPDFIIVGEHCAASYDVRSYVQDPNLTGSCDNGLGFSAISFEEPILIFDDNGNATLVGWRQWGASEGTRYSKHAGGDSITLTCNPAALAQGIGYNDAARNRKRRQWVDTVRDGWPGRRSSQDPGIIQVGAAAPLTNLAFPPL